MGVGGLWRVTGVPEQPAPSVTVEAAKPRKVAVKRDRDGKISGLEVEK